MKKAIDRAALRLAKRDGVSNLTCQAICEEAGVAPGSFAHYVGCSFTNYHAILTERLPADKTTLIKRGRALRNARYRQVLAIALDTAKRHGYESMTRKQIAEAAGVSETSVTQILGGMNALRKRVMREAIAKEILEVIAQGLARKNRIARSAPDELKRRAIQVLKDL